MGRSAWVVGGVAAVAAIAGVLTWLDREAAEPPTPERPPLLSEEARAEAARFVDVEGLPPLFPEGRGDHPQSAITLSEYFERFDAATVMDQETGKLKPEVVETLERELVGREVSWDGYVNRVQKLPSGRATLVIMPAPDAPGLHAAMIKFSSAESEKLEGYQKGDRVRVVAVYDKVATVFPALRGLAVERVGQAGLVSTE